MRRHKRKYRRRLKVEHETTTIAALTFGNCYKEPATKNLRKHKYVHIPPTRKKDTNDVSSFDPQSRNRVLSCLNFEKCDIMRLAQDHVELELLNYVFRILLQN